VTKSTLRCDNGACIELESVGGELTLSTTTGTGSVKVTAAEVRAFAAAVHDGHFDELLDEIIPSP